MPSATRTRGTHPRIRDARPDVLSQVDDPVAVGALTLGSNKRIEWRCERGHRWTATPCDRLVEGTGCPYCWGRLPIPGETDLATTHPDLADQLVGGDPTTLSAGSVKRAEWECSRKHRWIATVANRALRGSGCPYCSGRRAIPGETDFATTEPVLSGELVSADPTTFSRSSNTNVEWECALGHRWWQTPNARTNMGSGCPYCAGQKTLPGFNDLKTLFPLIAAEAVSIDPSTVGPGSRALVEWRCSLCLTHWETKVSYRTNHSPRPGCPGCHNSGFAVSEPAVVYLLRREHQGCAELKIGVTCDLKVRLRAHKRYGWALLDASESMLGGDALRVEQSFLRMLDELGVRRGRRGSGGEPGFTETWKSADYSVEAVPQIIRALEARNN